MRTFILDRRTARLQRLLLSSVMLMSIGLTTLAQTSGDDMRKSSLESTLPVVVMPSPNSATLTRNISENIDLYTGRLNVEIPLYTLKSRQIELPVSLQAVGNAHKVNDIGGWAGLGWHLNAGGVITRVMKNLPDEFNGTISPSFNFQGVGYLHLNTAQENYISLDRFQPAVTPATVYSINDMKSIINRGNWNTKTGHPDKGYDLQPDEFFFNFGKHSGKFVFESNGNVILTTAANMKVTPTISGNKITAFTVTTDDGFKYDFGDYALNAVEETKLSVSSKSILFAYRYGNCDRERYYTTQNGHTVLVKEYYYETEPYVMSYVSPQGWAPGSYVPGNLMDFWQPHNQHQAEYPTYPSSWYLTKITSPTGDIVTLNYVTNGQFTYVADRSFIKSEPRRIGTYDVTECSLTQGPYFTSRAPFKQANLAPDFKHYPSFGDYTISTYTITLSSKRLKDIVTSQGYKIEFVANTARPELPGDERLDKISIQYNGAVIKEYLLDYETFENTTEPVESKFFSFKAPVYLYPANGGSCYGTGWSKSNPNEYTRTEIGTVDASARFRTYLKSVTEKGTSGEVIPAYEFEYYYPANLPFRTSIYQDKYGFARDIDNTTPPVYNKLLAGVLHSIKYPTGAVKEFAYDISGDVNTWNGLRITSISEFESPGADPIVKNYSYGPFRATDFAINSYEMPDYGYTYVYTDGNTYYTTVARKTYTSEVSRVNPENLTRGAAGGYEWVEVSQFNNGSHRTEFYTSADHPNEGVPTMLVSGFLGGFTQNLSVVQGVAYPFPQNISNDWKRGLPKADYIKEANGTNIQSIHYNYDFTSNAASTGRSFGLQVSKYRIDFGVDWNWMLYGRYAFYPNWQLLKSKAVREYAADGQNYRETIVENTYNKLLHNSKEWLFVREAKLLADSKNEQEVQRFRYPIDFANTSDAFGLGIAQLKSKNVISIPVEKYQYKQQPDGSNKRYVSGILNKYHSDKPLLLQTFALQPSSLLTSFTESYTSAGSFNYDPNYKPVASFTRYNTFGNVEEQSEESDVKESYIWDYNNTYPIAKVTNAAFNDVAYTSFEADGTGNWVLGSTQRYTEKALTGTKAYYVFHGLSRSGLDPTKTYIISYWTESDRQCSINGSYQYSIKMPHSNGWVYWESRVSGVSSVNFSGFAYIDEVRLYPANAKMTTYTYDPMIGMVSECDPNSRVVYYEFDGLQRLKLIRDIDGNITKTIDYNYKTGDGSAMWVNTADKRCKPCTQNGAYPTNIQQVKQVNMNPNSQSYKEERWHDLGITGACTIQADWQNISGPICLTNANGYNTGIQRYVQQDMNPCSATGGTTRNYDIVNPAACPSNEPVWQPTEEYRCRPCSNPAYISKWRERKWVDMNPVSNRPAEWRETGEFCTVPPDFQNTGAWRCYLNNIGLPTAYVEREKRDMNPCSDTYNQISWVMENPDGSCMAVYPEIVYRDQQSHGTYMTADVYIEFKYTNGTPFSASNISVKVIEDIQSSDCDSEMIEHTFNSLNGSSIKLFENVTIEVYEPCYKSTSFYVNY